MTLTTTQVLNLTDSMAKAMSDFNAGFLTGTATAASNINTGVSGQGASALLGRVLAYAAIPDLADELALLPPASTTVTQVAAFLAGVRTLPPFYIQFFPLLSALDTALGGLNAFLVANGIQVNGYVAAAFNYFQQVCVPLGFRSPATIPTALTAATYFPWAAVDTMWGFTCSGATTFSSNAVGANANTSAFGGGVGQIYLYKVNAGNAAGSAVFTISYTNAAGQTVQATYTTTAGTPTGSGSLAAGYAVSGAIGSAITAVSGSGMTNGEQYALGIQLVRSPAY